jgi:hypothetical protein
VAESLELAQTLEANKFFEHINARIDEEVERSKDLLPAESHDIVREVTENAILDNRMEWLAKEGVLHLCFLWTADIFWIC